MEAIGNGGFAVFHLDEFASSIDKFLSHRINAVTSFERTLDNAKVFR
jgi:hypothetical protein